MILGDTITRDVRETQLVGGARVPELCGVAKMIRGSLRVARRLRLQGAIIGDLRTFPLFIRGTGRRRLEQRLHVLPGFLPGVTQFRTAGYGQRQCADEGFDNRAAESRWTGHGSSISS